MIAEEEEEEEVEEEVGGANHLGDGGSKAIRMVAPLTLTDRANKRATDGSQSPHNEQQ